MKIIKITFLARFSRWFTSFTHKKTIKPHPITNRDKLPTHLYAPASPSPGLTCPRCSFRILISISMLLSEKTICCPNCNLELKVDKERSQESLNALRKLQNDLNHANQIIERETKLK